MRVILCTLRLIGLTLITLSIMARITIKMIAQRCGLSISTVAYVLREPTTCIAKESTRQLVLKTAREMGYQGNFAAKALRTQRYKALGIMLPWSYGHYGELVMALDKAMKKVGYHGIFSFWENEDLEKCLFNLCKQGVDAIITAHSGDELKKSPKPVITYEDISDDYDCVFCDKIAYIHDALDFLTKAGYTKIGHLGVPSHSIRYATLVSELTRRKLPIHTEWLQPIERNTVPEGYHGMRRLLQQPELPQVIIVHSDLVAQGALNACHGKLDVPKQMGILSFDNLSWSSLAAPALTTVDRNIDLAAELLVSTAIQRLEQPELPPIIKTMPLELLVRDSVLIPCPDTIH